jgi:sterol 14-demethylase
MELQDLIKSALTRTKKKPVPTGLRLAPTLSGGLPLVGHTAEFVRSTIELLFRSQRECGEIGAIDIVGRRMVTMFGPEAQEAVFRAPDRVLSPTEAYKIMTPVFGKDVVYDATPERMAEQLKMLLPALKDRRMRTYGEAVVKETEASVSEWGTSGVVDFVDFCRVLTNFTSSRCLLGKEFREGMSDEFAHVYHDLEGGVTPLAYIDANLPIPAFRKRDKARVRMVEMIGSIVRQRRKDKREGEDFLQTLMESKYADGTDLSEDEITGLLLAGIFAGHHTSSVTTAWTIIELLSNPTFLQRAIEEVDRTFGPGEDGKHREVSHGALRELTYIESCVKEALRLHPPLFMLVRVAKEDFVYKDYFIPEGTWIVLSPTVAHRLPEFFKDPDAFDPDRFMPGREEDKRDFAYIAFGGGRHKCLGNAFAILQVKAIVALLLGQFELGLYGDQIASDFKGLVIGPKEPCRIRYRRRKNPSVTMAMGGAIEEVLAKEALNGHMPGTVPSEITPEVVAAAKAAGCPAHLHPTAASTTSSSATNGQHNSPSTGPLGMSSAQEGAPVTETATGKLRIRIDRDLCQGHGMCAGEAPELFAVGRDEKVILKVARPPAELWDKARAAAKFCPTRTIRIEED